MPLWMTLFADKYSIPAAESLALWTVVNVDVEILFVSSLTWLSDPNRWVDARCVKSSLHCREDRVLLSSIIYLQDLCSLHKNPQYLKKTQLTHLNSFCSLWMSQLPSNIINKQFIKIDCTLVFPSLYRIRHLQEQLSRLLLTALLQPVSLPSI